ncbi:MAG TPA: YciI-like protein [Steroidobacteraceae bacterium]|nr:YciI-like protein [Steroidobacteraceae bacterium]
MHFLLFYDFVPEYLQRRAPYRGEHLRLAWAAHERGELILGGALADPADGAVLLFQGADDGAVRSFAQGDPYVKAGLVRRWWVRSWTTVVGEQAATPVRIPG